MVFAIIPNETKKNALNVAQTVIDHLSLFGAQSMVFGDFRSQLHGEGLTFASCDDDLRQCSAIICIGGDGTIIHAAKKGLSYGKPVLGINAGSNLLPNWVFYSDEDFHKYVQTFITECSAPYLSFDYYVFDKNSTVVDYFYNLSTYLYVLELNLIPSLYYTWHF